MKKGSIGLSLFALCFVLPGLSIFSLSLWQTWQSLQAQNWADIQATVLTADLKVNRGDDSTTYRVTGRYEYHYHGKRYQSDRIIFANFADNFGSFQRDAYDRLKSHLDSKQPLTVKVNPKQPDQAVAIAKVHKWASVFGLIFGLVFAGVGGGLMVAAHTSSKKETLEEELKKRFPGQPWKWDERWQQRTLKSDAKGRYKAAVLIAALWNIISTPILFLLPSFIKDEDYVALFLLVFPLIGVALIKWSVDLYGSYKRFGEPTLKLDQLPVSLGGRLDAVLEAQGNLPANSVLEVKISCLKKTQGNKGSSDKIVWQDDQSITIDSRHAIRVPIVFEIPATEQATQRIDSRSSILWRLEASSKVKGADFKAIFDLPVFATAIRDHYQSPQDALAKPTQSDDHSDSFDGDFSGYSNRSYSEQAKRLGDWQKTGAVSQPTLDGQLYDFPAARHGTTGLFLIVIAAIFIGSGVFIAKISNGIILLTIITFIFGGIFFLVGALLGYVALQLLLQRCQITVARSKLTSRKSYYFGVAREVSFGRTQLSDLQIKSRMSVGSKRYYSIIAKSLDKNDQILVFGLSGKRDTQALVERIKRQFGID